MPYKENLEKGDYMNIFISYSHIDKEFALKLSSALEADGYDVFIDNKIPIGNNIYKDIGKGIAKADAVIVVISKNSNGSHFVANETISMLSFLDKGRIPLVIPVVLGKDTPLPADLNRFNYIVIPYESKEDNSNDLSIEYGVHGQKVRLDKSLEKDAIEKIRLILAAHDEKIKRGEEERRKSEEKVKTGLSKYIEDVFTNLKESEKRNKKFAFWLYLVSIVSLIATIVIAVIFVANRDWQTENIGYMIAYGVTCLFIIIILISLSKLLFTLAKSFMVEAIRCSDRIHAISFGKFFLDAYGAEASREEVLKAFGSWNIDNGSTSFRNQSGEDYDPKIAEIINILKK
ncbi:toll/interleukin-1 receptor domain-containing protein [Blautia sp. AF19-10LB]|nr:toll/interleukin-1 receptor domain-containing protein [Blautia sp. AF19-10LB]